MDTVITSNIQQASEFLKNGKVIVFPTETVYGIGASIYNKNALQEIYKVKNRPGDNPLIVHVCNQEQIKEITNNITEIEQALIDKFFPGALTIVFNKSPKLNNNITCGLDTVAIRMPSCPIAQELIKLTDSPICASSANLSGLPSSVIANHVIEDLDKQVPCILVPENNINNLTKYSIESTVVQCTQNEVILLRAGAVTIDELNNTLKEFKIKIKINKDKSKALCPGIKYKHYSPYAEVKIIQDSNELEFLLDISLKDIYFIGLKESDLEEDLNKILKPQNILTCEDTNEYTKNLYKFFREVDNNKGKLILCEEPENYGIGLTLLDRLQKASYK